MGLLTFSLNLTLDGCVDHQEGIADDETHAFFTGLLDEGGATLWGRVTYEMMESYWPESDFSPAQAPPTTRAMGVRTMGPVPGRSRGISVKQRADPCSNRELACRLRATRSR